MDQRETVIHAINHKSPAYTPIDFGATPVTGMHANCVAGLRDHYGLDKRPIKIHEPYQMLAWIDDDLKDAMGVNTDGISPRCTMFGFPNEDWKPWRLPNGLEVLVSKHFNITLDELGNTLIYPEGDLTAPPSGKMPKDGDFFDAIIRQEPIVDDCLNPEDNLEEFGPLSEDDLAYFQREAERVRGKGRAVVANVGGTAFGDIALIPATFMKHPKGIRDIAEWYMSTASRKDYIHHVFEKQCEFALSNLETVRQIIGDVIDVIFICGTDFGSQTSTFCSVKTFNELYAPYYKRVNDWVHAHTLWKTFKHSCGAVEKFIDPFIDCGFDILNPVQCSAKGMSPQHLKDAYGERIVFWGGGVDTQKTLPFGTPQEVREEVLQRCEILSQHGGFVFNAIHNLQANTPIKNIVAMVDAVHEFNQ